MTIYKYQIEVTDRQILVLPAGARILTVQIQGNYPYVWAMVNPDLPLTSRHIRIHGTGNLVPEPEKLQYISTFQMDGGGRVFHVFEEN